VFDAETGLHYNRARYYDPEQGQYLTPDPLGTPDGPNPYAYVAFNPLRNVDPDGLILFAFDGTDNSSEKLELERLGGSVTNVVRFLDLYADGSGNYVSGVGTRHYENGRSNYLGEVYEDILPNGFGPIPDRGGNYTGRERIERMWNYFIDEAEALDDKNVMDVDIVGFSRGAAQARDFANSLAEAVVEHEGKQMIQYSAVDPKSRRDVLRCQPVNLRFIGLFDTVLSTDLPFSTDYRLSIPSDFSYVAHAVALNEYRSQPIGWDVGGYPFNAAFWNDTRRNLDEDLHQGGFPLESIGASSQTPGQIRIERGFIGAHADIGGGYAAGENQLSFVALDWMVKQAQLAQVKMSIGDLVPIPTTNPIIHDQSNSLRIGHPDNPEKHHVSREIREGDSTRTEWELLRAEDREVRGAASGTTQRTMGFTAFGPKDQSMTNADTHEHISYFDRPVSNDADDTWNGLKGNQTGTVDIAGYMVWLKANGYAFTDQ
jgi:RHS repeat-associated protein